MINYVLFCLIGLKNFVKYLFFLIAPLCNIHAQSVGFLGKKWILHSSVTQPLLQKGWHVGAEYAIARNMSLQVGFYSSDKKYTQVLNDFKTIYGNFPDEKGNIKTQTLAISAQYYLNQSFCAPLGSFIFVQYERGLAHMRGNYYKLVSKENVYLNEYLTYDIKNIQLEKIDVGIGRQFILGKRFTIRPQVSFTVATVNAGEKFDYTLEGIANNYGGNTINFGQWQSKKYGGFGISSHIYVGIFLL